MSDRTKFTIMEKLNRFKNLSSVEKCVLDAIMDKDVSPKDFKTIADTCNIYEVQAMVAVQLLKFKGLITESGG